MQRSEGGLIDVEIVHGHEVYTLQGERICWEGDAQVAQKKVNEVRYS